MSDLLFEILCNPFASLLGAEFSILSETKSYNYLSWISKILWCWTTSSPGWLWWHVLKKTQAPQPRIREVLLCQAWNATQFSSLLCFWMNLFSSVSLSSCDVGKWKGFCGISKQPVLVIQQVLERRICSTFPVTWGILITLQNFPVRHFLSLGGY